MLLPFLQQISPRLSPSARAERGLAPVASLSLFAIPENGTSSFASSRRGLGRVGEDQAEIATEREKRCYELTALTAACSRSRQSLPPSRHHLFRSQNASSSRSHVQNHRSSSCPSTSFLSKQPGSPRRSHHTQAQGNGRAVLGCRQHASLPTPCRPQRDSAPSGSSSLTGPVGASAVYSSPSTACYAWRG